MTFILRIEGKLNIRGSYEWRKACILCVSYVHVSHVHLGLTLRHTHYLLNEQHFRSRKTDFLENSQGEGKLFKIGCSIIWKFELNG